MERKTKIILITFWIAIMVAIPCGQWINSNDKPVEHFPHIYPKTLEEFAYDVSPAELASLVVCIIEVESNWQVNAVSKSGDYGLMQINKYWWSDTVDFNRIFEPEYNIKSGIHILETYINLSGGCIYNGLRKYNGSSRYPHSINNKHKEKFGTELF